MGKYFFKLIARGASAYHGVFLFFPYFMFTAAALSLSCHSALGAQARESGEYSHTFGAADYKMNRDGVKEEIPVNGTCRITPRLPDMGVLTHFQVPEGEQTLAEWSVTASVLSSDGPAAGVALWSGGSGCVLSFYPDGRGYLRGYKGREVSWSQDISVRGFSFPADITLERDANGSVLGRVNGIIAAARVLDVNLKKPSGDRVTTVSFATRSTKERPGAAATYGTLEVNGWGRAGSAVF